MKLTEFRKLIREEVRKVLNTRQLNEAFKSNILRSVFKDLKSTKTNARVASAFADSFVKYSEIALDQVTDADIQEVTPAQGLKMAKSGDRKIFVIFFSKQGGKNPYAKESWNKNIEPNTVIAIANGANEFLDVKFYGSYRNQQAGIATDKAASQMGYEKSGGRYGTGIVNVKRASEISDTAYVIDANKLAASGAATSVKDKLKLRTTQKTGAVAFLSPEKVKQDNLSRYREILTMQAAASPVDKLVLEIIEGLTRSIADAVKASKMTKYDQIMVAKKGNKEITASDAAYFLRSVLDAFEYYTRYKAASQRPGDWYDTDAAKYAKQIKDYHNQFRATYVQ